MKTCSLEADVLSAVLAGQVPNELRAHAASCAVCGEAARVASLVRDDCARAQREAQVPAAGVVWLRAQIRAREEAARAVARPIVFTQALAVAALIGLLVSVAGRLSSGVLPWPLLTDASSQTLLRISIVLACGLVLAPVALYVAFSRD
ncbi:MAG: hypothetical protein ND807_07610 [Vicinamibacterales bacterium]|nr:hypothetical protein [Vicinamibacterales bacterium]